MIFLTFNIINFCYYYFKLFYHYLNIKFYLNNKKLKTKIKNVFFLKKKII